MITSFSPEVIEKIGYYVYRLIDPTNGQTFYVGKGKGNRVFAHVNAALENYKGENFVEHEEDLSSLKISTIRAIKDAGLEVIHIIQRWNLTEQQAFLLESTLIDLYGLDKLANSVKGFDHEHGVCNAETLEKLFHCDYYIDSPENPKYMIIKTQEWHVNEVDRYFATRHCWKVNPNNVKNYPYVLSVTGGIVREVYKVDKWQKVPDTDRYEFEGTKAEESIRNIFINKRIPEYYSKKGMASAVLYCKI